MVIICTYLSCFVGFVKLYNFLGIKKPSCFKSQEGLLEGEKILLLFYQNHFFGLGEGTCYHSVKIDAACQL